MFWEDLERPLQKFFTEPYDPSYFNYLIKKGLLKLQNE